MKFEFSTFKTVASCSILMLTNLTLSGQEKLIIDDDVVTKVKIIDTDEARAITTKEIEDYTYLKGKVPTDHYQRLVE